MSVTVRIHRGRLHRLAVSPSAPIGRQLHRKVVQIEALAKLYAPVDTGNLRRGIHIQGPLVGLRTRWDVVAPAAYASFIHKGYREYRHGSGRLVYARAGARPFLVKAMRQVLG
ncbi:HK97 gp10 family phage protein [Microbispora cellulosiformans]|uniref:HK97 gp10 family phage protein n=1 Tax=Microbispora cellulosiformans TaxID=2614688 RepID=A0A5J5K4U0_9ACTN|nr:HK97 gp10 family phage protein [Microbispora cellulosiformans]KAA9379605.1 HK97 gp10 family phage protein [Microbispora cellulosiformans]